MAAGPSAQAPLVVLDTNVFVAAGFKPDSASGRIVRQAADGLIRLAWTAATRAETRQVLDQIPRLDCREAEALFDRGREFPAGPPPDLFAKVSDPADRKFAALAQDADAILITSDSDLLSVREELPVVVRTPSEWLSAATPVPPP